MQRIGRRVSLRLDSIVTGRQRYINLTFSIRSHHFLSPAILIFVSSAVSVLTLILKNSQYHRCLAPKSSHITPILRSLVAGNDLRTQKTKAYTRNFPRSESTVERGQTALGIPCSDISIDQRAASAILSSTVAASGRGLYASHAYKNSE